MLLSLILSKIRDDSCFIGPVSALPALLLPLRGIRFQCVSRPKGRQTLCPQGIRTFFARRKTCDADTARLCSIIDTMIFSEPRDPRFITIRRGGTLSDANHHLLAIWAAECAEHVLPLFEAVQPLDPRPRRAVEQARAWTRGEITMTQARSAAGYANAAARELSGAARHAAHAAGQAAAVAHVAAHELGAAAYAIKAARAAAPKGEGEQAGRQECQWQREQLPDEIRELVLDDQRLRNDVCWLVFDC